MKSTLAQIIRNIRKNLALVVRFDFARFYVPANGVMYDGCGGNCECNGCNC